MKKFESMVMFGALALTCVGLFMSGLNMLNEIPKRGVLWAFVISAIASALIYFGLFLWTLLKKDKNNKKSRKQINVYKMKFNKKIFRRTIGIAMISFFSALLGYFFTLQRTTSIYYLLMIFLFMLVGAFLSASD